MNEWWKHAEIGLFWTGRLLTVFGSETLDTILVLFISKTGLDIVAADKFAKSNKVKTTDKNQQQSSTPFSSMTGRSLLKRDCFNYSQKQTSFTSS